nr:MULTISPECIES: RDD family protein [Myxococcaceae]
MCVRCQTLLCGACRRLDGTCRSHCATCLPAATELADVGTRFVANLVDSFWVGGAVIAGLVVDFILNHETLAEERAWFPWWMLLATVVAVGVQLAVMHRTGQSIGKRLLRIRVMRMDGSPVSLARLVFVRNLPFFVVNQLCGGILGLVDALCIFGEQRRCLHDLFADTQVVVVPPPTPPSV